MPAPFFLHRCRIRYRRKIKWLHGKWLSHFFHLHHQGMEECLLPDNTAVVPQLHSIAPAPHPAVFLPRITDLRLLYAPPLPLWSVLYFPCRSRQEIPASVFFECVYRSNVLFPEEFPLGFPFAPRSPPPGFRSQILIPLPFSRHWSSLKIHRTHRSLLWPYNGSDTDGEVQGSFPRKTGPAWQWSVSLKCRFYDRSLCSLSLAGHGQTAAPSMPHFRSNSAVPYFPL